MAGIRLTRRTLLAGLAAAPFVAAPRSGWPHRPVTVMVPYPPAGGADTTARILYAKVRRDSGPAIRHRKSRRRRRHHRRSPGRESGPGRLHHPA